MQRSLPGQQAGSVSAYQRDGAAHNGRTVNAGMQSLVGGADWIGDVKDIPGPITCIATRKDGNECVAKPIGEHEYCIGHLRGSKEIA
jgi:hypothetical protein